MARYASFRFDDGFLAGALKANALLGADRASFFIVTGLVEKTHRLDHIPLFAGREFGTIEDWTTLARAGHDIQPHSVTHPELPLLARGQQIEEVERSLAFVKKIHAGPYIFCHPYNALTDLDFAELGFAAAGFSGRGSQKAVSYNDLSALDPYLLQSSVLAEDRFDWLVESLRSHVPENAWVILGFHSFDGEGAKPWSTAGFSRLVAEIRKLGFQIKTISSMIRKHAGLDQIRECDRAGQS
jgi:peptidoglycan/xylan/chitin deacetylase (PgdA/CDA1 family)